MQDLECTDHQVRNMKIAGLSLPNTTIFQDLNTCSANKIFESSRIGNLANLPRLKFDDQACFRIF